MGEWRLRETHICVDALRDPDDIGLEWRLRETHICADALRGLMGVWASGGIGRRARLKILFSQGSEGSSPSSPTKCFEIRRTCGA